MELFWLKTLYSEPNNEIQALNQFYAFQGLDIFGIGFTQKEAPKGIRKMVRLALMKRHYNECINPQCSCKWTEIANEGKNDKIKSMIDTQQFQQYKKTYLDLEKKGTTFARPEAKSMALLQADPSNLYAYTYQHHWSQNYKNFRNFSKMLLEKYGHKFPKSSLLKIHTIQYLIEEMGLYHKAFILLEEFKAKDDLALTEQCMMHELLQLYNEKLKNVTEDKGKNGLNIMDMIIYTEIQVEFHNALEQNALKTYKFWSEFLKNQIELKSIFNIGLEIFEESVRIEKLWSNITSIVKKRVDLPYLLYSIYNYIINNSMVVGNELATVFDRIVKHNLFLNDQNELTENNLFSDNNMYFAISAEIAKSGTILICSDNVVKYLGYTKDKYIGKNIENVMPTIYRKYHAKYVSDPIETQQNTVLATTRRVFYLHKDDYIHPCLIQAKTDHHFDYGMVFLGILRPIRMDPGTEYILIDENGYIDSCTKRIKDKLNLEHVITFAGTNHQYGHVNIDSYCSEFQKINQAFTYYTKLPKNKIQFELQKAQSYHQEMMEIYDKYGHKEFEIDFKLPKLRKNLSFKMSVHSTYNSQNENSITSIKNRFLAKRFGDRETTPKTTLKENQKPENFPSQTFTFACFIEDYWIRNNNLLRIVRLRTIDKDNARRGRKDKTRQNNIKRTVIQNVDNLTKIKDDDSLKNAEGDVMSLGDFEENNKAGIASDPKGSYILKKNIIASPESLSNSGPPEKMEQSKDLDSPLNIGEEAVHEIAQPFFQINHHTGSYRENLDEFHPYISTLKYVSTLNTKISNDSYPTQLSAPLKHLHKAAMPIITNSNTSKIQNSSSKNMLYLNKLWKHDMIIEENEYIDGESHGFPSLGNLMGEANIRKKKRHHSGGIDYKIIAAENQPFITEDRPSHKHFNSSMHSNMSSGFLPDHIVPRVQSLNYPKAKVLESGNNRETNLKKVYHQHTTDRPLTLSSSDDNFNPKHFNNDEFGLNIAIGNYNFHNFGDNMKKKYGGGSIENSSSFSSQSSQRHFERAVTSNYISPSVTYLKYFFIIFIILNILVSFINYILEIKYIDRITQSTKALDYSFKQIDWIIEINRRSRMVLLIDTGYMNDTRQLALLNISNYTTLNYARLKDASTQMRLVSQSMKDFLFYNIESMYRDMITDQKLILYKASNLTNSTYDTTIDIMKLDFFESILLLIEQVLGLVYATDIEDLNLHVTFILNNTLNSYLETTYRGSNIFVDVVFNQVSYLTQLQYIISSIGGLSLVVLFGFFSFHLYVLANDKVIIMKTLTKIKNFQVKIILKRIELLIDTFSLTKNVNRQSEILQEFMLKKQVIENEFDANTMLVKKSNPITLKTRGFFREIWIHFAKFLILTMTLAIYYLTMPLFYSYFEDNSTILMTSLRDIYNHLYKQRLSLCLTYQILSGDPNQQFKNSTLNQYLSELLQQTGEVNDFLSLMSSSDRMSQNIYSSLSNNICETLTENIYSAYTSENAEHLCNRLGNGIGTQGLLSMNSYMSRILKTIKDSFVHSNLSFEVGQELFSTVDMVELEVIFYMLITPSYANILDGLQGLFALNAENTKNTGLIILIVLIVFSLLYYLLILVRIHKKTETSSENLKKFLRMIPMPVIISNKALLKYLMKRSKTYTRSNLS